MHPHRNPTLIVLFCLILLVGCQPPPAETAAPSPAPSAAATLPTATPDQATPTLGLITPIWEGDEDLMLPAGAQEAAESAGARLLLAAVSRDDASINDALKNFAGQNIQALIAAGGIPLPQASLQSAGLAGIPLVLIDGEEDHPQAIQILTDLSEGGIAAAGLICQGLRGEGQAALLLIDEDPAAEALGQVFEARLEQACPQVTLAVQNAAAATRQQGEAAVAGLMQNTPELEAVFATDEELLMGALDAIQAAGRPGVILTGPGKSEELLAALQQDRIAAAILLQPGDLGRLAVETALEVLAGQQPPRQIVLPARLAYSDPAFGLPLDAHAPRLTIGAVLPETGSSSSNELFRGFKLASRSLTGVKLDLSDAQNEGGKMAQEIDRLTAKKVDALLIDPLADQEVAAALRRAAQAGIPLFSVVHPTETVTVVSQIGRDPYAAGRQAAERLCQSLDGQGSVAELQDAASGEVSQQLSQGFKDYLQDSCPQLELAAAQTAANRQEAAHALAAMLAAQPQIDGLFAHNDLLALGALQAAQTGAPGAIRIVAYGESDEALLALKENRLDALVGEYWLEMGQIAMETALEYLYGRQVEAQKPFPPRLITANHAP